MCCRRIVDAKTISLRLWSPSTKRDAKKKTQVRKTHRAGQMEAIRRGRADKYVDTISPPEKLRSRSPIVDFNRPHSYDKQPSSGATSTKASAKGASAGSSQQLKNSLSQKNNAWYSAYSEPGESIVQAPLGKIPPAPSGPKKRPALEKQDPYTKSRNLAKDDNRYSYVNDCCDTIHRDVELRYALPKQVVESKEETHVVLPEIKYHPRKIDIDRARTGQSFGGGSVGAAARRPPVATVMEARHTRLSGVANNDRFVVSTPTF